MKKYLFCLSFILGCMLAFSVTAFAAESTSYALDALERNELLYSIYGDEQTAPVNTDLAGTESVNPASGSLNMEKVDLALPGKAGMDVIIKRQYNNQFQTDFQSYNMIPGTLIHVDNYRTTPLLMYKYYINGNTNDCVYLFYHNEQELLETENATAQITTSSDYISHNFEETLYIQLYTIFDEQYDSSINKYFYFDLPSGTDVTLTRFINEPPIDVTLNSCYSYEQMQVISDFKQFNIGNGWHISLAATKKNDTVTDYAEESGYREKYEYGEFVDEDGTINNYFIFYSIGLKSSQNNVYDTAVYNYIDNENDNRTHPTYKLYVDYMFNYGTISPKGFKYRHRIVNEATGITLYFNRDGGIVAKEDKFGNIIIYEYVTGSSRNLSKITDTYGREIIFNYTDGLDSISVEGVTVVSYNREIINNTDDPADVLEVDDTYLFSVTYGDASLNNTITYKSMLKQDRYNLYSGINAQAAVTFTRYCIDEIIYPTGGKKEYDYNKTNVYFHRNSLYRNKFKLASKRHVLSDGTVTNEVTYSYNNPNEGIKYKTRVSNYTHTTTVTQTGDNFITYYTYNFKDYLLEEKQKSNTSITETDYEYTQYNDGTKRVTKQTTKQYEEGNPDLYVETINETSYNSAVLLASEKVGNLEKKYYYGTYGLLRQISVYNGTELYSTTLNTLSADGKTITNQKVYSGSVSAANLKENRTYTYTANGELASTTQSPDGTTANNIVTNISYTYLNLDDETNPDKNTLIVTTSVNNVSNITDAEGNELADAAVTTVKTYDLFGNVITETDGNNNQTHYRYDSLNRIIKQINPDLTEQNIEYNSALNYSVITDEKGNKTKYQFDSLGRFVNTYVYNPDTEQWIKTEEAEYNSVGLTSKETVFLSDNAAKKAVTSYQYYPGGKLQQQQVRENSGTGTVIYQTNYAYTDYVNDPDVGVCTKVQVALKRDNNNTTNIYQYINNLGQIVKEEVRVKQPDNSYKTYKQTYTYDFQGNLLTVKDFRANDENWTQDYTTKYDYDYAGNVLKQYNANNKYIENVYDGLGRVITQYDYKRNASTFTYNALGQVKEATTPAFGGTAKTKYYYDKNGNNTVLMTQNNKSGEAETYNKTGYIYDSRNRVSAAIGYDSDASGNPIQNVTQYSYDAVGNVTDVFTGLTAVTDLQNISGDYAQTTYDYNYLNQNTKVTDPLNGYTTYTYNLVGAVTESVDKLGVINSFSYNAAGQLLSKSASLDGETETVSYTYDMLGNRLSMTDDTGTTTYTYDDLARLLQEYNATTGVKNTYTYNAAGGRTSYKLTVNAKEQINQTYTYDNLNRLTSTTFGGETVSYTYDDNNNLLSETRGTLTTNYTYNTANQVTGMQNKKGADVIDNIELSYYANGNLYQKSNADETTTYEYDGLGRLKAEGITGAQQISYVYDNYSNRTGMNVSGITSPYSVSYDYNKNNQLMKEIKQTGTNKNITYYAYDANGNLISKNLTEETAGEAQQNLEIIAVDSFDDMPQEFSYYTYNLFGKLTYAKEGTNHADYAYNGDGLRVSKTVNNVTTNHIWDNGNIVAETNGNNSIKGKYYRGLNLIASENASSVKRYYLYNQHGDVIHLTDSNKNIVQDYTYDAFGVQTNTDATDTNPFRYCGEYFDTETGSVYLRNRYYDSSIGRFITEDPVKDGLNWYVYCSGNPVMFVDPLGLWEPGDEEYSAIKQIMLRHLGNTWNLATTQDEKDQIHQVAEDLRKFDDSSFNRLIYLNDEDGAEDMGHAGVLLLNNENKGVLFSFYPTKETLPDAFCTPAEMRFDVLTESEVNNLLYGTGQVDSAVASDGAIITSENYNRFVYYDVSAESGNNMFSAGVYLYGDPGTYYLVGRQCDNIADQIMTAGGYGYSIEWRPNATYESLSEEHSNWGLNK